MIRLKIPILPGTIGMRRSFLVLLSLLISSAIFGTGPLYAAQWLKTLFDREVPAGTRTNVQKAVDLVADLLTQYNIVLTKPITVHVTGDTESYIQAGVFYRGMTRANAEEWAKYSAGVSIPSKNTILIHGTPSLMADPAEAFRVLPHELFHQVQSQYGRMETVNWLSEGAPEVFQFMAREKAGLNNFKDLIRQTEQVVRKAPDIPATVQLASYDYKKYTSLVRQNYPVYEMSVLMAARLTEGNGFENLIFFYQLLHGGTEPDKAFTSAFRVPMSFFLAETQTYFEGLRRIDSRALP